MPVILSNETILPEFDYELIKNDLVLQVNCLFVDGIQNVNIL